MEMHTLKIEEMLEERQHELFSTLGQWHLIE